MAANTKLSEAQNNVIEIMAKNTDSHYTTLAEIKRGTPAQNADLNVLRSHKLISGDNYHYTLTDLGREYAIAQGWLAAPTEAQQAAPVASADSGGTVSDAAQIKTLDALVKAQHELMDKLEYNSLEYRAEGYTLTQLQLRLERIRNSGTIARLEAENAKLIAALEAKKANLQKTLNAPMAISGSPLFHYNVMREAWFNWISGVLLLLESEETTAN